MAVSCELQIERNYFEMSLAGRLGVDEYADVARRFFNDARVHPDISGLLDLRDAQLESSFEELAQFLGGLRRLPRNTHGRVAVDPVAFGVARTFAAIQGFVDELRVFADYETARAWLRGAPAHRLTV